MKTIVEKITKEQLNTEEGKKIIGQAGDFLKEGGLVAFPTETVYGLGADALNKTASTKIYAAKGRPSDNPLIVHVADMEHLEKIVKKVPKAAYKLAEAFWPGPLTLVFKKSDRVNDAVTGGQDTVAIRCPSHPVMRALLKRFAGATHKAVTAPSANTFGRISPTNAKHVADDLGVKPEGKLDMILDGGECEVGVESTIVNLTSERPTILRHGAVTAAMLSEKLGFEVLDAGENAPRVSGRLKSHYAPQTKLQIVPTHELEANLAEIALEETAFLMCGQSELAQKVQAKARRCIVAPADVAGYAHILYAAMHDLDASGAKRILVQLDTSKQAPLQVYPTQPAASAAPLPTRLNHRNHVFGTRSDRCSRFRSGWTLGFESASRGTAQRAVSLLRRLRSHALG